MKNRLNITIDESLIKKAKRYAEKNQTSLSQLIEQYLKSLTFRKQATEPNFLEYLDSLPKPKKKIIIEGDLKENYYENRKKKYGF